MPEKEYIEREAVLNRIQKLQGTDTATVGEKQFSEGFFLGLDEAEIVILQTPTADVAEVVRCKDCVNLRASADGYSFCAKWDVDSYEEAMVRFDDFCSYGERRK